MSVRLDVEGAVGELVLDRPERINALDEAAVAEFQARLDDAERAGVRALVLHGEGRGFCSGRDLTGADPTNEDATEILNRTFNPLVERIVGFPAPTFAAVHGACLGAGFGIALACDVVCAADDARLGSPFARLGAVVDSGAHAFLVERIGTHRALELIYSGRLISGRDAASMGLVNRSIGSVRLLEEVRRLAAGVASGPTQAFLASKRIVRQIADERLSLAEVLAAEATAQGDISQSHDYREGVLAFQEKRTPQFLGT